MAEVQLSVTMTVKRLGFFILIIQLRLSVGDPKDAFLFYANITVQQTWSSNVKSIPSALFPADQEYQITRTHFQPAILKEHFTHHKYCNKKLWMKPLEMTFQELDNVCVHGEPNKYQTLEGSSYLENLWKYTLHLNLKGIFIDKQVQSI